LLFTESKTPIEKIVKKTHSELKLKHKRRFGVLHAVKEKPLTPPPPKVVEKIKRKGVLYNDNLS